MLNFKKNIVIALFNLAIKCPLVKRRLEREEQKIREEFKHQIKGLRKNPTFRLPETPMKPDTILTRMEQGSQAAKTYYTNGGKVSGAVYTNNDEHWDFISEVMRLNIEANPLHITEFSFVG